MVDRYGNLVAGNDRVGLLFEDVAPELLVRPVNVLRVALHPRGMAPRIVNLEDWAHHILEQPRPDHLGFAVPLRLRTCVGELRLLTTITTFATAVDVTIAELRLETFLPADDATATALASIPPRAHPAADWC